MANLTLKEVTQEIWDAFVTSQPFYTFLHSWAWGEFHKLEGETVYRVGFYDEGQKIVGAALLVVIQARRGRLLFCPHGPLLDWNNKELVSLFFKTAREIGRKEGCWFIRISPILTTTYNLQPTTYFSDYGYIPAPIHMHSESSWILDVTPLEEQLLAGMRKTTRYLVRQGEKLGIKVLAKNDKKAIENFIKLHHRHAREHNYVPFSRAHILHEWQVFYPDNIAVFEAVHKKKLLASAIIIFYGKWAFYYQAVTIETKIPGSYVLLWEAIKEAKRRDCRGFNFWGIAPLGKPRHPWAGLTLFKQGFGGERVDLLHACDLPLSPLYWLTYLFETIRRIKRGF